MKDYIIKKLLTHVANTLCLYAAPKSHAWRLSMLAIW